MATGLLLGLVQFESFEVPARISWGGRQRLAVHLLPGGGRVIDAMGRDDARITWSGVFTGGDGGARARLLDVMRGDGGVWPLSWDAFFYSVVISEFQANFEHANWIPYRVACTVLRDELEAAVDGLASLAADLTGDLTAALASGLDVTQASAALAVAGAQTDGTAANAAAGMALAAAVAGAQATVATSDALAAPVDAGSLLLAGTLAGQAAQAAQGAGYLARAQVNLANAGT
jgi:hypothetical protein